MNVELRLREQNNGEAWLDCNAHGLGHRWYPDQVAGYWGCKRCPVATRTEFNGNHWPRPNSWLTR